MALGSKPAIASMKSTIKVFSSEVDSNCENLMRQGAQFFIEQNYPEALQYLTKAYEIGKVQNNLSVCVRSASLLGEIYADRSAGKQDFDQALKYLDEAINLIKKNPNLLSIDIKKIREKLLVSMCKQGLAKKNSEEYAQAFELFTKVYDNSLNDPVFRAQVALDLANLYHNGLGRDKDVEKAFQLYNTAYKLGRNIPEERGRAAFGLGGYYKEGIGIAKDYAKALEYFFESYNVSINDPYGRGVAASYIGRTHIDLGQYMDAKKYLEEAYRIARQNDYKEIIFVVLFGLGGISVDQKDYTKAMQYLLEAYDVSVDGSYERASVASGIGDICAKGGESVRAIKYLDEAYTLGLKYGYEEIVERVANAFGELYRNGNGVEQNDDKAIQYYETSYKSKDLEISSLAAYNLGRIYLYRYNSTKMDLDKGYKLLEEAAMSMNVSLYICEGALHDLYAMKQVLLSGFDKVITTIEEDMLFQSYEHLHPLLEKAWGFLRYAGQMNISFGSEKDLQIRNSIAEKWKKFCKVRDAARAGDRKKRNAQEQPLIEEKPAQLLAVDDASVAMLDQAERALNNNEFDIARKQLADFRKTTSTNIDSRKKFRELEKIYAQKKVSDLLNAFKKVSKDYSVQPSQDIFEQALNVLDEATELASYLSALGETSVLYQISHHCEELYKKRSEAKKVSSFQKEEKMMSSEASSTAVSVLCKILDAFDEIPKIPESLKSSINLRLVELAVNPRPSGAKKIKGFSDTWRIRVGDYRILYVLLSSKCAIGIVRIDARKDVYDALDKKREDHYTKYLL